MRDTEFRVDDLVYWKLASMEDALTMAVADPVSVEEEYHGRQVLPLSVFYDCTEDEQKGFKIMTKRIKRCPNDLGDFIIADQGMVNLFYSVQEFTNTNSRRKVWETVIELCRDVMSYGNLVESHQNRELSHFFLKFPKSSSQLCLSPLVLDGNTVMGVLSFNQSGTYHGLTYEVVDLQSLGGEFLNHDGPIQTNYIRTYNPGEGFSDSSYRGRLALTEELLRRAEYVEK